MTPPPDPTSTLAFDLVTDGGLDAFADLENDVPFAPFTLNFGPESFLATELPRDQFFERLTGDGPHPTTSQPSPDEFATLYRNAERPVLAVTISAALSGSLNAADQARALAPDVPVTLHDARTLSGAQAFQVHAAMTARARGLGVATAIEWMKRVHDETELYFTIDTLEYLRRGGRIGRVQAALGGLLQLKPVVTVDKETAAYETVGRTRSWSKALVAIAQQLTDRFGEGTPLRVALMYGAAADLAETVLEHLRKRHRIVWSGTAPVGVALAVHTGPVAIGLAAAPGAWPWERDEG